MLSQTVVGWLLLLAAVLMFAGGIVLQDPGRPQARRQVRAAGRAWRSGTTPWDGVLFGQVANDALDDEELDQMILMPAILMACGLCLTAIFLLGYELVT